VVSTNPKENLLTVQKEDRENVTYSPARLHGISAYRELEREFSVGDRLQFTAPNRELGVANRDLATVEQIDNGQLSVRMDNGKAVTFDANEMRHFDHGYAVTSHSSQGLTADRVLIHADTGVHPDLLSDRFGYVAVSRASLEASIFTDDAAMLKSQLCVSVSKTSALEVDFALTVLAQGL
jgi:ATP-dependent exoDNAse (exonuclease V) alpha subunit